MLRVASHVETQRAASLQKSLRKSRFPYSSIIIPFAVFSCFAVNDLSYDQDDWVTFKNFRYVRCVDAGTRNAYIGTTEGLLIFDLWKNQWASPLTMADGLPAGDIQGIRAEEDRDRVWVQTGAGTGCFSLVRRRWEQNPWDNPFSEKKETKPVDLTNLYIVPPYFYDGRSVKDRAFTPFQVTVAQAVNPQQFMLGTWGLGAGIGNLRMQQAEMKPLGLWEKEVSEILWDGRSLWFGPSLNASLTRFRVSSGQWTYQYPPACSELIGRRILCLAHGRESVWAGTDQGILVFDLRREVWDFLDGGGPAHHAVQAMAFSSDTLLWAGTNGGLCIFDFIAREWQWMIPKKEPALSISCILPSADGAWVGTDHGLYRCRYQVHWKTFGDSGETFKEPRKVRSLQWQRMTGHHYFGRPILCLSGIDSMLWVGGEHGLAELNPANDSGRTLGGTGTPVNGPIRGIAAGLARNVWLATDQGAVRTDFSCAQWVAYAENDGLPDRRILAIQKQDEYIWLGTAEGATRCHEKAVERGRKF